MGRVSRGDPLVVNIKSKWTLFTSLHAPGPFVNVFIIVHQKSLCNNNLFHSEITLRK